MAQIIGNIIARRTDSRGYTVTITDYIDEQPQNSNLIRRGTKWITAPHGETVKGGYWMDWPEANMDEETYAAMPRTERAALECWYQVERYHGLACNFEHHRFGDWLPTDTFFPRLTMRFTEVWEKNQHMHRDEVWEVFFEWAGTVVKRKPFLKQYPVRLQSSLLKDRFIEPVDRTGILMRAVDDTEQPDEQPTAHSDASPTLPVAHEQPGAAPGQSPPDTPENASGEPGEIDPFEAMLIRISTAIHEEGSELCSNAAVAAAAHILRHWQDTIRDHVPPLIMAEFKRSFREDIADTRQAFWEIQRKLDTLLKVVREDYPADVARGDSWGA